MNTTDKARELGTEHGTRAAEEWLSRKGSDFFDGYADHVHDHGSWCAAITYELPEPQEQRLVHAVGYGGWYPFRENWVAYSAAFTAAVEATIRTKCEEVR